MGHSSVSSWDAWTPTPSPNLQICTVSPTFLPKELETVTIGDHRDNGHREKVKHAYLHVHPGDPPTVVRSQCLMSHSGVRAMVGGGGGFTLGHVAHSMVSFKGSPLAQSMACWISMKFHPLGQGCEIWSAQSQVAAHSLASANGHKNVLCFQPIKKCLLILIQKICQ